MSVGRSTGTAVTGSEDSRDARIHVDFVGGEEYAVRMRGHHVATDQPLDNGGVDRGPSPVELFVASMAACTAYYAGRYLDRHHVHREGLRVSADYRMAADRPARVERVRLDVRVPDGTPANLRQGLHAVVSHCTVHNTLRQRPEIHIDISDRTWQEGGVGDVREPVVGSVMTRAVVTARPGTTFKEVAELLADNGISAVPVVDDDGTPIGVVSEADLLAKQEYGGGSRSGPGLFAGRARRARWRKAFGTTAGDVMSKPVIMIDPGAPVSEAAGVLAEANVRRLFVVDRAGELVGVLARRDLLRSYLRDDGELREDIRRFVFRGVLWVDPDMVGVVVEEGVVTLSGELDRRSEVDIAIALTRELPGVVGVRSELVHGFEDDDPGTARLTGRPTAGDR